MSVLDEWDMCCPKCRQDDCLDIAAIVWVRLFENGTDEDSSDNGPSHEWDDSSKCQCGNCGWDGIVKQAKVAGEAKQGE